MKNIKIGFSALMLLMTTFSMATAALITGDMSAEGNSINYAFADTRNTANLSLTGGRIKEDENINKRLLVTADSFWMANVTLTLDPDFDDGLSISTTLQHSMPNDFGLTYISPAFSVEGDSDGSHVVNRDPQILPHGQGQDFFSNETINYTIDTSFPDKDDITGWSYTLSAEHSLPLAKVTNQSSIIATAEGSNNPQVGPVGSIITNGDFTVDDEGPTGSFNPINIGAGDGVDETTSWVFDFSSFLDFNTDAILKSAELVLELTPRHSLFVNDGFELDDLGVIGEFNTDVFKNLSKNTTEVVNIELLDFYSSSDILAAYRNSGGILGMTYLDDAVISIAQLVLTPAPVPEPSAFVLLAAGLAIVASHRRKYFFK